MNVAKPTFEIVGNQKKWSDGWTGDVAGRFVLSPSAPPASRVRLHSVTFFKTLLISVPFGTEVKVVIDDEVESRAKEQALMFIAQNNHYPGGMDANVPLGVRILHEKMDGSNRTLLFNYNVSTEHRGDVMLHLPTRQAVLGSEMEGVLFLPPDGTREHNRLMIIVPLYLERYNVEVRPRDEEVSAQNQVYIHFPSSFDIFPPTNMMHYTRVGELRQNLYDEGIFAIKYQPTGLFLRTMRLPHVKRVHPALADETL